MSEGVSAPRLKFRTLAAILVAWYALLLCGAVISEEAKELPFAILFVGLGVAFIVLWVPAIKSVRRLSPRTACPSCGVVFAANVSSCPRCGRLR